jgi:carbamoyltransferase
MVILGINQVAGLLTGQHDAAAALIVDGKLVASVEEERLNRQRHSKGYPKLAIEYCLKEAGLTEKDIDIIAVGYNPYAIVRRAYFFLDAWNMLAYLSTFFLYRMGTRKLRKLSGAKLMYIDHHLAHAASAYRAANFGDANVLTIDNAGETETASLFEGRNGKLTCKAWIPIAYRLDRGKERSIGAIYSRVTALLKLGDNAEGKTMGLASYGDAKFDFSQIMDITSWDAWTLNRAGLKQYEKYGRKDPKAPLSQENKDLAASLQKALEDAFVNLGRDAHQRTGLRKFALSGGCALNCNANSRLAAQDFCDDIFIQPASHDGGIALGAALEAMHRVGDGDFVEGYDHAYWGPGYSNDAIEKILKEAKVPYKRSENIEKETAQHVAHGKIVGWFQGRSELGPRALGNRSILANPGSQGMNDKVNVEVKHREVWRPFAPSVVKEDAPKYFEGLEKMDESPFMLQTHYVRKEFRDKLPAITHVDGSARIQTVTEMQNPRYYGFLKELEKLTGMPIVMNTSFNDVGEPIVQTPKDAVRCFFATGFDVLAIGDFLVVK